MTIVEVDVLPYAVPLAEPLVTARGVVRRRGGFVIRLRSDRGEAGLGEAAPHPHAGDGALNELRAELAVATRWLVGASVDRLDDLLSAVGRLGGAAAMGIDLALHDLVARARAMAVAELLGGTRCTLATSALLVGDAVADALAAVAGGHRAAKLKASGEPGDCLRTVAAVRRAAPGLGLRIDANGVWDDERALHFVRQVPAAGIEWIEQPVVTGDLAALARVRAVARTRGIPIAADEAVTGAEAVHGLAAAAAADVLVLKLVQVGGLRRAMTTARAARAARLRTVVTTAIESSIGTAAALHLAAALRATSGGHELAPPAAGIATAHLLARDIVLRPIGSAASMTVPAGPGLGVDLDERALAAGGQPAAR